MTKPAYHAGFIDEACILCKVFLTMLEYYAVFYWLSLHILLGLLSTPAYCTGILSNKTTKTTYKHICFYKHLFKRKNDVLINAFLLFNYRQVFYSTFFSNINIFNKINLFFIYIFYVLLSVAIAFAIRGSICFTIKKQIHVHYNMKYEFYSKQMMYKILSTSLWS